MIHRALRNKSSVVIIRYLVGIFIAAVVKSFLCLYPIRALMLSFSGSKIGKHTRIYNVSIFNFYKEGFVNFVVGDNVYIGMETMIDLADKVIIDSNITIAERVVILTHTNVGYNDHSLKKYFPDKYAPVKIGNNVFIDAGSLIMPGVTIEDKCVIGATSLVLKDVKSGEIVGGVPAKVIGRIDEIEERNKE